MKKSILFTSLFFSVLAMADLGQIEKNYSRCMDNASSNNEMKQCAFQSYEDADTELNQVYNSIRNPLLAATDADSKEILKRLVKSERAWIALRDADCELEGVDMLGGSGEGLIIGGCLYRKTAERIKFLQSVLQIH